MTDPAPIRARELFEQALEQPPAERAAFLDGACRAAPALRNEVDGLLDAHAAAGAFLERPAHAAAASEQAGQMIGRYKLLQPIGEGGFGSVWMAEQREPVKRRVALKVIKLGMDTKQVIARFEAERQALALMEHPHIAKVLDAGATETGRPYFVMELVRGMPILEYCDKERLDTRARLELFVDVCHAIQHAHQKGVIHRDIKPSNILVTLHDGRPVPKVIDFGIAKATNAELTERTLFTEHRQMIGTPAYMSPEQAELSGLDIDTRADIYSLGVLLYELLTGTTPFDPRKLLEQGLAELLRVIREVEPHKPSTRISTLGDTASHAAERRHSDVRKLGSLLRGDLDWIVMRCLEKDRSRRYETADGLALDVRRHLDGDPVTAAPPSKLYRLRKFVARNRGPVAAAALVGFALILGVIGTTLGLVHAREQRTLAEHARARSERVQEFVQQALVSSDPSQGGNEDMRVGEAMLQALAGLDARAFAEDPETEAVLRATIANILIGNGRASDALAPAERALAIRRGLYAGDDPALASSLLLLGSVEGHLGRTSAAEPLCLQGLEMLQRLFHGDHPAVAEALHAMGSLLLADRPAEAEAYFVQSLEMNQRLFQGDREELAISLGSLANARKALHRAAEAEPLMLQSLEMLQRLHPGDHPSVAAALGNLGHVRELLGRAAEAEPLHEHALEMCRRLFAGDHPDVATCINNLAHVRVELGRLAEAEPLLVQSLEMNERLFPGDHPTSELALTNLARVRLSLGRAEEARALQVRALEMSQRLYPGDHAEVASNLANLAQVELALEHAREAEPLFVRALEMQRRLHPGDHAVVASALERLGSVRLTQLERPADAEPLFVEALAMRRRLHAGGHPAIASDLNNVARARALLGQAAEALPLYRESLAMQRTLAPDDASSTTAIMTNMACCLADLGQREEALRLASEAAAIAARTLPAGHRTRLKCEKNLAEIRGAEVR